MQGNLRALLSTLHAVLWEGAAWTQPELEDLLEPDRVKKSSHKAMKNLHPDKAQGSLEQIVIAGMVVAALNDAWTKFESAELKRACSPASEDPMKVYAASGFWKVYGK